MRILIWLLISSFFPSVSRGAIKASFDCRKASTIIETAICADAALAEQDRVLAKKFAQVLRQNKRKSAELRAAQKAWIASRDEDCKSGERECLLASYAKRLGELSGKDTVRVFDVPPFQVEHVSRQEVPISLIVKKGGVTVQQIDLSPLINEPVNPVMDLVSHEDLNFDGRQDLMMLSWAGATGNTGSLVFLFDPKSGKFLHHKELSELPSIGVDPTTKTITSYNKGGHAGAMFTSETYRWEGARLVKIEEISQDEDEKEPGTYVKITKALRQGALVEVKREKVRPE